MHLEQVFLHAKHFSLSKWSKQVAMAKQIMVLWIAFLPNYFTSRLIIFLNSVLYYVSSFHLKLIPTNNHQPVISYLWWNSYKNLIYKWFTNMWTCLRASIGGSSDFVVGEHSLFHCRICSYMFFTHVFKKCNFKRSWEIFYWWWWCCHSFCSSCVSSHLINFQCQERKNTVEILLMLIYYEPLKLKRKKL